MSGVAAEICGTSRRIQTGVGVSGNPPAVYAQPLPMLAIRVHMSGPAKDTAMTKDRLRLKCTLFRRDAGG
jgi:hypothetical protein